VSIKFSFSVVEARAKKNPEDITKIAIDATIVKYIFLSISNTTV